MGQGRSLLNVDARKLLILALMIGSAAVAQAAENSEAPTQLNDIQAKFGPVLQLEGNAQKEINAIANLLSDNSKLKSIDATKASGEMCMLETVSKHNMVHFNQHPEHTTEDIVYYINPEQFIANGLDVAKLPRHPEKLGEMKPLQWYYYDGTYVEPHQGSQLNKPFVIMSLDVK
ncbi:MAG: hypothetical protein MRJ67_18065 [Nitrospirales bacterium]|nr:hypothetical protein [Nitrospira sp.]MDR4462399.1 hypothetical protein [Nitrospirales bacterium]